MGDKIEMKTFEFNPYEETSARVVAFLHSPIVRLENHRTAYPTVIVCPGGGYQMLSETESELVAMKYYSMGYNTFILYYSLNEEAKNCAPLKEISSTIMKIRDNGEEWGCLPEKIAVCGFSAGGHLASSISTFWNHPNFLKYFDNQGGKNKPNAIISCYGAYAAENFQTNSPIMKMDGMTIPEAMEYYSLVNYVNSENSPTFMWHCMDDDIASVEHAITYIGKLRENNIYSECHLFPEGGHGIGICVNETNSLNKNAAQWVNLSINFLNKLFDYEY